MIRCTRTSSSDPFARHDWVVSRILEQQAQRHADKPYLVFNDVTLSYAETARRSNRLAAALIEYGIEAQSPVAVLLPNGPAHCLAWLGIARAGAVHVAVNTQYKGRFLSHVLTDSAAKLLFCDGSALPRVAEIEDQLDALDLIVTVGPASASLDRIPCIDFATFCDSGAEAPARAHPDYRDIGSVLYTSGTTGPAKGVLMPHAHTYLFGLGIVENLSVSDDDIYYVVLPLFHANGLFMQLYPTMIAGATAIVRPRFSASRWIAEIAAHGATITNALGVMSEFVLQQPPSEHDRAHRLRVLTVAPNTPALEAGLKRRFGIRDVIGLYGMTEVNIPLYCAPGANKPGSCGKVWRRFFDVRIVDPDTDEELPPGTVGEIVVRPQQPFGFMAGYLGLPEKTVEATRNFWFHTGDAATMDADGYCYFVDRIKDCIRRRGENIASYDIEAVLQEHPAVAEACAIAVPADIPGGEDEIKALIVCEPGQDLSPQTLIEFCTPRMPAFALPRYLEFVTALPKTPTEKVQKSKLREAGITPDTWDRVAPGRGAGAD